MTSVGVFDPASLTPAIRLFDLGVDDAARLRAAHELVCRDPRVADWVTDGAGALRAAMGTPSPGPVLESGPVVAHPARGYLPVLVLAEVLPALVDHQRRLGVPPEVTSATLADVGRSLVRNRLWEGEPGLGDELAGWLTRHLHGALVQLGRLQYERAAPDLDAWSSLAPAGVPGGPGDLVLNLHIPQDGQPLTPDAVDASLDAARGFFATRFPDERYAAVTCHSWLLDPQLAGHLPPETNIVRFQRRFVLGSARPGGGDASVRKFVFGDTTTPVESLPRVTRLQAAVVDHLSSGAHFEVVSGWIPWP